MQLILASNNQHKATELQAALNILDIEITPQSAFNVSEVAETGLSFVENALIKARHAAMQTKQACIADDSGLVVPSLNGAPGIYSARYAGEKASDADNNKKLLQALIKYPKEQRQASFYCILVFLRHAEDPVPLISIGQWDGTILTEPHGEHGFGYDPIFYVPEKNCSAAKLSLAEKNTLSHRGKALKSLLPQLQQCLKNG